MSILQQPSSCVQICEVPFKDMDLRRLLTENPQYLPVSAVAEYLNMAPAALRASIEQGRCPFGFSWKLGERAGYKIPTVTFLAWYAKGLPVSALTI